MAEHTSDEDKQLAQVIGRIFSDEKFAQRLEKHPEEALREAGVSLSPEQKKSLAGKTEHFTVPASGEAAISWTKPLVRVLTKGTKPVVQVAVNSVIVKKA